MANHLQEIKKSVSFVFSRNAQGGWIPWGTGFFVGVVDDQTKERTFVYFVTAKHVLKNEQGCYLPEIALRLNTKEGGSVTVPISLVNGLKIFEHPDPDVDLAVINCVPGDKVDFKVLPHTMIANNEVMTQQNIAEGDDIFFVGLFTSHVGQTRNQPIVRFGKIALVPDDKIEWREVGREGVKLVDLYLLECQSFGGNSGSPVFVQISPMRQPGQITVGGPSVFLTGVMTGSFLHGSKVRQLTEQLPDMMTWQNLGIAAVTPAHKLYEILFSDEAAKLRLQASVPASTGGATND